MGVTRFLCGSLSCSHGVTAFGKHILHLVQGDEIGWSGECDLDGV
jgi:hypothetical protein